MCLSPLILCWHVSVSGPSTGTTCLCQGPPQGPRACVRALHRDHVPVSGPSTGTTCLCQGPTQGPRACVRALSRNHVSLSGPCLCQAPEPRVCACGRVVSGPYPGTTCVCQGPAKRVMCLCQDLTKRYRACVRVVAGPPA